MSNSQPGYYERLLDESLHGNKYSLKELKFMAGAGEAAAQYHLALYYEQTSKATLKENGNYVWWIGKAVKANYMDSISRFNAVKPAPEYPQYRNVQPFFKHVLSSEGRITRTENFTILLILNIVSIICMTIFQDESSETSVVLRLAKLPLAYLAIMAGVRRCHDTGGSGLRVFIPLYAIYLLFAGGDKGNNEYGSDSRGEAIQQKN